MEITCNRCHRTVQVEDCYCPACGLPQLFYSADEAQAQGQPERWNEAVRDAGTVAWKPALRAALLLAVPAGVLCGGLRTVNLLGLFWMAAAAAWAVFLYVRSQKAPWITIGAGARIGLVTGLLGGWTAAGATSATLFATRFFFHQGKSIDDLWQSAVNQQFSPQFSQQWITAGGDAHSIAAYKALLLSPQGRAGMVLSGILIFAFALLLFAVAGGALGARLMVRTRRPGV